MNTMSGCSSLIASTAASLRSVQFSTTFGIVVVDERFHERAPERAIAAYLPPLVVPKCRVQRLHVGHRGRIANENGGVLRIRIAERAPRLVVGNDAPARLDFLGGVSGGDRLVHGGGQVRPLFRGQRLGDLLLEFRTQRTRLGLRTRPQVRDLDRGSGRTARVPLVYSREPDDDDQEAGPCPYRPCARDARLRRGIRDRSARCSFGSRRLPSSQPDRRIGSSTR